MGRHGAVAACGTCHSMLDARLESLLALWYALVPEVCRRFVFFAFVVPVGVSSPCPCGFESQPAALEPFFVFYHRCWCMVCDLCEMGLHAVSFRLTWIHSSACWSSGAVSATVFVLIWILLMFAVGCCRLFGWLGLPACASGDLATCTTCACVVVSPRPILQASPIHPLSSWSLQ